jgi:hypothetical protein
VRLGNFCELLWGLAGGGPAGWSTIKRSANNCTTMHEMGAQRNSLLR